MLVTGNAAHADIPLDAPGSGLMGLLLAMLGQTVGFPVPEGGAGELTPGPRPAIHGRWGRPPHRRRGRPHRGGRPPSRRGPHRGRRAVRRRQGRHRRRDGPGALHAPAGPVGRAATGSTAPSRPSSSTPGRSRWTGRSTVRSPGRGAPELARGTVHVAESVADMATAMSAGAVRRGPGSAVHAHRPDDGDRPDPFPGGDRVLLGVRPRAPARPQRRGGRRPPRGLGPRRLPALRRPHAGPHRAPGPGLRRPRSGTAGPRPT